MPMLTRKENRDMQELERKPYSSSETMRVRCPHCRKLYMVQFNDVKEAKPRFECVQCHQRFWVALADTDLAGEIIGLPIQLKEAPARAKRDSTPAPNEIRASEPCPKCARPVRVGVRECPFCGVFVAKVKQPENSDPALARGVAHSPALAEAWKHVIANYMDERVHAEFLRLAERENNLTFVAAQYAHMCKLMPSDESTVRRLRAVETLAQSMIATATERDRARKAAAEKKQNPRTRLAYSRLWQVPLVVAAILIFTGLTVPMLRNVVGIGAALMFLAAAIRLQTRA